MIKAFIDTNVFADVFLKRKEFLNDSSNILELCSMETIKGFTSATSFSNLYYILKKAVGKDESRRVLSQTLKIVQILPVDEEMISEAISGRFNDFEDEVQYHCANRFNMDYIITRNEKDFIKSKITVLSPKNFLDEIMKR